MNNENTPEPAAAAGIPQPLDLFRGALRLAATSDGAMLRCKRRRCRETAMCQMRVTDGQPLDCGGDLTDDALLRASLAALYALALFGDTEPPLEPLLLAD